MSRYEEHIQRILRNPLNVSFHEIENILVREGWKRRKLRSGSSHIIFVREGSPIILPIPYQRPHIGKAYVKRVIQALELDEECDTPEKPPEE